MIKILTKYLFLILGFGFFCVFLGFIFGLFVSILSPISIFSIICSFIFSGYTYIYYYKSKIFNTINTLYNFIDIFYPKKSKSSLIVNNNIATLNYNFEGKDYTLRLPYNYTRNLKRYKVMAKFKYNKNIDGIEVLDGTDNYYYENITQQPGIPYIITPNDISAEEIIIKRVPDKTISIHKDDEKIILPHK